jgi:DNA-binding transcriptional ArsR family regulator
MKQDCYDDFEQVITLLMQNQPLFFALGDMARQEIVILLGRHERLSVGELAGYTELSRPAVSHHLKVLKGAGLLRETREGVRRYYQPVFHEAVENIEQLMRHIRKIKELV